MRFSLHIICITAALLLGGHIDANLDPVSHVYDTRTTRDAAEAVTLTDMRKKAEVAAKPASASESASESASATLTPTATATPKPDALTLESVKAVGEETTPLTPTEELKKNLNEVGNALKEGFLGAAQFLNGAVGLFSPLKNIVTGLVTLSISLAKLVWFTGKAIYATGIIISEFAQSFAAQK